MGKAQMHPSFHDFLSANMSPGCFAPLCATPTLLLCGIFCARLWDDDGMARWIVVERVDDRKAMSR